MRIKRRYYGWLKNDRFHLSLLPPDAPVRPCISYDSSDEIRALLSSRRGMEILWWPPLPDKINAEIAKGIRTEA